MRILSKFALISFFTLKFGILFSQIDNRIPLNISSDIKFRNEFIFINLCFINNNHSDSIFIESPAFCQVERDIDTIYLFSNKQDVNKIPIVLFFSGRMLLSRGKNAFPVLRWFVVPPEDSVKIVFPIYKGNTKKNFLATAFLFKYSYIKKSFTYPNEFYDRVYEKYVNISIADIKRKK